MTDHNAEQYVESEHCAHMTEKELKASTSLAPLEVNIGLQHNWSEKLFKGECKETMPGELYIDYLKTKFYGDEGGKRRGAPRGKETRGSMFQRRRTGPSTSWMTCQRSSR